MREKMQAALQRTAGSPTSSSGEMMPNWTAFTRLYSAVECGAPSIAAVLPRDQKGRKFDHEKLCVTTQPDITSTLAEE